MGNWLEIYSPFQIYILYMNKNKQRKKRYFHFSKSYVGYMYPEKYRHFKLLVEIFFQISLVA